MSTQKFFTDIQQQAIIKSIEKAELNTSGEIRLHVEDTCKINPIDRAIEIFEKLEMHKTELHNGDLFYFIRNNLNEHTGWVKDRMKEYDDSFIEYNIKKSYKD